jgi:hypothetical protein
MNIMEAKQTIAVETAIDVTLIDWFLTLSPAQRLAELESRLAFFAAARSANANPKLPANTPNP